MPIIYIGTSTNASCHFSQSLQDQFSWKKDQSEQGFSEKPVQLYLCCSSYVHREWGAWVSHRCAAWSRKGCNCLWELVPKKDHCFICFHCLSMKALLCAPSFTESPGSVMGPECLGHSSQGSCMQLERTDHPYQSKLRWMSLACFPGKLWCCWPSWQRAGKGALGMVLPAQPNSSRPVPNC